MRKFTIILALALAVVMAMGISTAFAAGGASYGSAGNESPVYTAPINPAYTPGANDAARAVGNANKTGVVDTTKQGIEKMSRAVTGQTTHGNYKSNTNSCASCHATHTAANGEYLLIRNTLYNTCLACHDGTMDVYNVFGTPATLKKTLNNAIEKAGAQNYNDRGTRLFAIGGGTFAGGSGMGSSVHLSNDTIALKAAPGGNRTSSNTSTSNNESTWGASFDCASCHAPHGSYSSRLLHYNPNNIANVTPVNGGLKLVAGKLKLATSADKTALGTTVSENVYAAYYPNVQRKSTSGGVESFTTVDVLVNKAWMRGTSTTTPGTGTVVIKDATGTNVTDKFDINFAFGYVTPIAGYNMSGDYTIDVQPAIKVTFNMAAADEKGFKAITSYTGPGNAANTQLNDFCGACHTDYNSRKMQANKGIQTSGRRDAAGTFVQGYRHSMRGDNGCLLCHYAHGTTKEIMHDSGYRLDTATDVNPSSALKRFVNMSLCWNCHSSSAEFSNDLSYDDAFGTKWTRTLRAGYTADGSKVMP